MHATRLRILIVDDDSGVVEDLRRILGGDPSPGDGREEPVVGRFEIDSVRDCAAALEKVIHAGHSERPYSLAFVDVRAPLGLEGIAHLWKVDPWLQIVACASAFDFSWETMAARLGAHGDLLVVRKPFSSLEVRQMAHTLAKKWLLTRHAQLQMAEMDRLAAARAQEVAGTPFTQTQTLEAVGQLAAGVAHDFNNLLTIIQGHSSRQLASGQHDPQTQQALREIASASERAAGLTRQLLAFSQRQVLRPHVLQLNALLADLAPMLRSLVGESIALRLALADDLPPVWADQAGIEQIIINLVLNARDAMPDGGGITIATRAETVGPKLLAQHPDAVAGEYVRLSVFDTGIGMDETTRARIFDPFFTTKSVDRGTGMGLATVHGLTRQHGGWIDVVSAPGEGSAFSIFLPVTERIAEPQPAPVPAPKKTNGARTILVVEDDEAVRSLVTEILQYEGYRVLEAENADAAVRVWTEHHREIELLLTDIVMPGSANGLELSRQLLALKPELRVIYTSGYSADLFGSDVRLQEGVNYLPKPYLSHQLTGILRVAFGEQSA